MKHPRWPNTINPILIGQLGAFEVQVLYPDDYHWDYVEGIVCDVFPGSLSILPTHKFKNDWDSKVEVFFDLTSRNPTGKIIKQLNK